MLTVHTRLFSHWRQEYLSRSWHVHRSLVRIEIPFLIERRTITMISMDMVKPTP